MIMVQLSYVKAKMNLQQSVFERANFMETSRNIVMLWVFIEIYQKLLGDQMHTGTVDRSIMSGKWLVHSKCLVK